MLRCLQRLGRRDCAGIGRLLIGSQSPVTVHTGSKGFPCSTQPNYRPSLAFGAVYHAIVYECANFKKIMQSCALQSGCQAPAAAFRARVVVAAAALILKGCEFCPSAIQLASLHRLQALARQF